MTLRHIRIFVEVSKTLNATTAAGNLHISQPAVSLAIKELEEYYGVQLFDRIAKRLYLTSAGEHFLHYATSITALFDEMETNIRNWDALGRLRIGSSITIGTRLMPGYVRAFTTQWPQVQLKIVIDSSDIIIRKVLENELDLALIEGVTNSPYLVVEPFMDDVLAVICSIEHPLAAKGRLTLDELRGEKLLLRETGSGTRDLFDHVLASLGVIIEPAWESTSTTALLNAVANNLGVAVISLRLAQESLAGGRMTALAIEGVSLQRKFNLIYHVNKLLTPSAQAFLAICRQLDIN